MARKPPVGQGLLVVEVYRSHSAGHTTVGKTPLDGRSSRRREFHLTTHNIHNKETSIPPVGFETAVPAKERPPTHTLDRAAIGIGYTSCASACKTNTTQNQPHQISNTQRTENKTTYVVIQQHSRKLLMMDILMSEICWAHKKWNKIISDIKLVFHSSTITMVHGPINIRKFLIF